MNVIKLDLPEEAAALLKVLANLRATVARKRLADLRIRFPEISDQDVDELNEADLIMQALKREIAHQRMVSNDISQGKDR